MRHLSLRLLPLALAMAVLLAALPAAASPRDCPLHPKSRAGLMPPACLSDPDAPALSSRSGAPDATFLSAAVSAPTGSWSQVLAAGDFDGPAGGGRAQLGVGTERYFDPANDRQLHVFSLDGAGVPKRDYRLPAGASPEAAQPIDANHDGVSDLVLALAGEPALAIYTSSAGALSGPALVELDAPADALAALDVTGDLRDDLVAVVGDTLRFWRSSPAGPLALSLRVDYPNDGYNALAVGDFNSDGYDDIAALRGAGYATGSLAIFFQQDESFVAGPVLSPQTGGFVPSAIAAGDLDGDGQDDLAVTAGGEVPDAYLSLFYQKNGALATTPVVLNTFHLPSAIVAADINHDGREDLVLADDGWLTLSIFTQRADGTFDPQYLAADIPYSDRYRPDALVVADLDGNGGLDAGMVGQPRGLTVLTSKIAAPIAVITSPAPYATVPAGTRPISGTTTAGTVRVEVRVRGLTGWTAASLTGTSWSAAVNLPATLRAWWIEARAIDGAGRVQAPPARHRVRAAGRVRAGLLVEYPFDERSGTTVHDRSEVGAPLDLTLADEPAVSRVPEGYFVTAPTRIASPAAATKVTGALKQAQEFTLETWIRAANLTQDGPARILTLSEDSQYLNFSLVQSRFGGDTPRVGLRLNTSTPPTGQPWHELVANLPLTTDLTHVLVTRAADGTVIFYLNGVEQGRSVLPGDFSSWDDGYQLLFANDALTARPWRGEYHLAAIYQRALTPAEVGQNYAAGPLGDGTPAQLTDAQLVYTFDEGSGSVVGDSSLVLPALPAQIAEPAKTSWGSGALSITAPTIIATQQAATRVSQACMATGEVTIEAWVTPATTTQNGPARIVTLAQDTSRRNLTLGQGTWGNQPADRYLARLRSTATSQNGEPHLTTPPGSLTPALTHVVYTRDAAGTTRLFVDGVERARGQASGDLSTWDTSYRLALANEFTMNRAWLGSYHFLAIYSRALSAERIGARFAAGPTGDGSTPPATSIGPYVQRVVVNGGAETTADRTLALDINVQVPAGQTLDRLTVAEYGFDASRKVWQVLQRGTPASTAGGGYSWQLTPGAGVRYLQVWAADSAGTRSSYPYQTFINLTPARASLARKQTDVYRFALRAGEQLTVQIAAARGDADLYVWGPAGDPAQRWVSNSRGSSDAVTLTAPVDGLYQVEVYGFSQADYQLSVARGTLATAGAVTLAEHASPAADEAKLLPAAPVVGLDDVPAYSAGIDTAIFLPLVAR